MKNKVSIPKFGERLRDLRQAKGMTQQELAGRVGVSRRAIAYYESEGNTPIVSNLPKVAGALGVSLEELLGIKKIRPDKQDPGTKKLWKKFQQVRALPERDQRAIIRMINSLVRSQA